VSGLIECAKSDRTVGEEINIATQHEISIGILAETLIQRISSNVKIVCNNDRMRPDKSEVERLLGSIRKYRP
jgi:dTDP-glucose 4,6-dehydratase